MSTIQCGTTVQGLYERERRELPARGRAQHRAGIPVRIFLLAAQSESVAA
ncbi:hypothetical protein C8K38_111236 [Rhodococcus sp. OK611]|nr:MULTISPECIES: hypothetical protein [unclassified Rhodococcus (in: high G+C Gram-positive bacteria)]PTR42067.1 hypothetical protein C8K38_111236 [Rhodococcus sp. OK611]SNX91486.1 hypothetical protein SAMN05447004_11021 [Rhodococcus sp. OK270]